MHRILDAAGSYLEINNLLYRHGRHELSMAPGFCGTPTVVLSSKAPDSVSFNCSQPLEIGALHTLILASGHELRIRVISRHGERVHATVLDHAG